MVQEYGVNRVLEPQYVLPTSAWKLDNSRSISNNEMRVNLKTVHIEGTSFKQICIEANNNEDKIKQKIIDIVIKRGKLHNPVTDTGGLFCGTVSEIGKNFDNPKELKVGEDVVYNASLASIPIHINKILNVNMAYGQVEVEGYAIMYSGVPLVRKPEGLPIDLLLFTFNESGTLYRISTTAVGRKRFLIVGNNLMLNLVFGYAVRRVAREDAEIVCLFDKKTDIIVEGKGVDDLLHEVFTEVHFLNILHPLECVKKLNADSYFDVSVNCADIPGAETVNILSTKSGGTVVFTNLINNYNIALYITEAVSRQLNIMCADGYLEAYDEFDIELVKGMAPYLKGAKIKAQKVEDDPAYPLNRESRLIEVSGQRKTMLDDFVCESRAMATVLDEMLTVAKYDCNVLITGESGVGKEKAAHVIVKNSSRKMLPFVKINCGSMSPDIAEAEFFGIEDEEKGVLKKGYFELVDNGIMFLEDVSELSLDIQVKLLRLIQEGEFHRMGSLKPVKSNVRIISSTNKDLEDLIEEGKFRRELYYRLNVFRIRIPNLSERVGDIPYLIRHFLSFYQEKFGITRDMDQDALEYLTQCEWKGNIRELENVVQRLMIAVKTQNITLINVMRELHADIFESGQELKEDEDESTIEMQGVDLSQLVDNFEKNIIKHACEKFGSTRKSAKALGISQTQLVRKKKKYNI